MGLSLGRALGYALKGTATGFAKAAQAEDERRDKYTQVTLAASIKKAQANEKLRIEKEAEAMEEIEAVRDIMKFAPDGKALTKAEATQVYKTAKNLGMKAEDVIKNFKIASDQGAGIKYVEGSTKTALPDAKDMTFEDTGGLFAQGASESILNTTRELLKGTGYADTVQMPKRSVVEGVTLTPINNTEVELSTDYLLDENNMPLQQVITRREYNPRTKQVTLTYLDNISGEQIKPTATQKISSSADAFSKEKPFSDFGPLMVFGADGLPQLLKDENGTIVAGYLMKNGEIRLQKAGKISEEVYDSGDETVLIAGKDYAPSLAGGDLSAWGKLFKFPPVKEFYVQLPALDVAANGNDLLFNRSKKRLDIHAKYGDSLYGIEGGFADLVTATNKFVKGTASIVLGLSGMKGRTLDEKVAYLDSSGQITDLRYVVDNQDELMKGVIGTAQEISMARTIDAAIATVTAYDLAKQTGDTRISNADFDAYISTVTGNTAEQTINLIRNGLDDSLTIYSSQHRSLNNARNRIPDVPETAQYQASFDKALTTVVHPAEYRKQFNEMFAPFEKKQDAVPTITTADFDVMPVEKDADGIQIRRVVMKDGKEFTLRNPRFMTEDVGKEIIRQAIQKRQEALAAAEANQKN